MKDTDIRKYAELMKELGLTGLEITEADRKIRLERAVTTAPVQSVTTAESTVLAATESTDYISIKSPIVGLFYAAPAENADPYVSLGDTVRRGQTLCIVEAMKLMSEINADCDGTIEKICVANGQMVEYGTELFRIKR